MRRHLSNILFSAGDLNAFIGCAHATTLAIRVLDGEDIPRRKGDKTLELAKRRGIEHEADYLEELRAAGRVVVEISDGRDLEARVQATREAMAQGVDVVFQAALLEGAWHGFADFLVRTEVPSSLGSWSYDVVDTKLAQRAKASHVVQLGVYADLVAAAQGLPPPALRVRLGSGKDEVLRPADIVHYTRNAKARLEAFIADRPPTRPEPCTHCSLCDFADHCEAEWNASDHLSLVANMRRPHAELLREAGVETLAALAGLPKEQKVPGLSDGILLRLRSQARLQLEARQTGERTLEPLAPEPGRGFARLPEPAEGDVYFDMEGDPLFPGGGLEYLFGMVADDTFSGLWAHDRAQEKIAFEAFVDRLTGWLKRHPRAHVYHYNHYETTALKNLSTRHATRQAEIDDLLRRQVFVDLYAVVREALRIGEPRYSLKNVERFYREARDEDVSSAGDSIVAYEMYRENGDEALLRQIRDYNEADCRSTADLHRWLLGLRPTELPWRPRGENTSKAEADERRAAAEAEIEALRRRLVGTATRQENPYRHLVADLVDFHRREQKPQWWAFFEAQGYSTEQLIDHAECIGDLVATGPNLPDLRSFERTYAFPPQITKRRAGDDAIEASTGVRAGSIAALDEDACTLTLRRGRAAGELPDALSLGPLPPQDDGVQRKAMQRFAASVADGDGKYPALERVLRRDVPHLPGHRTGQPLLNGIEGLLDGAIRVVSSLEKGHVFIQGPPGTGKTWTTSRIALALLKAGRRVAVSSLSHKAINNLLAGIEAAAAAENFSFRGVKKASKGANDQAFEGECIKTVTKNEEVGTKYQLVAGTAWLLAREEHDQAFDTLIIDEAGQVSLANLIAAGVCARNIVLVGDQQQLSQPIQAAHPEGTGVSALEHILEGRATVPEDMGIFLGTSYRMHPAICGWISEMFYDGRLQAHETCARQALHLGAGADPLLAQPGIRMLAVAHQGRSQSCPEEAEEVARLWKTLVGATWTDRDGETHAIRPEDILVVSPYNVQVNLLTRRLPNGARVGTVDKFQGQEAPVVLVSMATSSGEEMPRDVSFLFSPNRLNVALSRAKCLAIVLASPALLATSCKTAEQVRSVNTFIAIGEIKVQTNKLRL